MTMPPDPFEDDDPRGIQEAFALGACPACHSTVPDWRHFRGCINDAAQVGPGILVEPERPADIQVRVTLTVTDDQGRRQQLERTIPYPRAALLHRLDVHADGLHLLGIPFTAGGLGDYWPSTPGPEHDTADDGPDL